MLVSFASMCGRCSTCRACECMCRALLQIHTALLWIYRAHSWRNMGIFWGLTYSSVVIFTSSVHIKRACGYTGRFRRL